MTDNEIIKALESCKRASVNRCEECPYKERITCALELRRDALDLINRQQAEIERLQKVRANILKVMKENISQTETEAIKEFERKIKAHAYYIDTPKEHRVVDEDDIDAVLKEMTEGCETGEIETPPFLWE